MDLLNDHEGELFILTVTDVHEEEGRQKSYLIEELQVYWSILIEGILSPKCDMVD